MHVGVYMVVANDSHHGSYQPSIAEICSHGSSSVQASVVP